MPNSAKSETLDLLRPSTKVRRKIRALQGFNLAHPRPPHWGGYRLQPQAWQFWQGRKSRLHDRLRYTPNADGTWLRERLAP